MDLYIHIRLRGSSGLLISILDSKHAGIPLVQRFWVFSRCQELATCNASWTLKDHARYLILNHILYFPKIRGPQSRPQNITVLIMGSRKKVGTPEDNRFSVLKHNVRMYNWDLAFELDGCLELAIEVSLRSQELATEGILQARAVTWATPAWEILGFFN